MEAQEDKLLLTTIYHSKVFAVAVMAAVIVAFAGGVYLLLKKIDASPQTALASPSPLPSATVKGARTYIGPGDVAFPAAVATQSASPTAKALPSPSPSPSPSLSPTPSPSSSPLPSPSPSPSASSSTSPSPSPAPTDPPPSLLPSPSST